MMGTSAASFFPTTTTTKSVAGASERIAAERNVSLDGACPVASGGHGSKALSRPMREDSPAARITPAKLAAKVMLRRYQGMMGNWKKPKSATDIQSTEAKQSHHPFHSCSSNAASGASGSRFS